MTARSVFSARIGVNKLQFPPFDDDTFQGQQGGRVDIRLVINDQDSPDKMSSGGGWFGLFNEGQEVVVRGGSSHFLRPVR